MPENVCLLICYTTQAHPVAKLLLHSNFSTSFLWSSFLYLDQPPIFVMMMVKMGTIWDLLSRLPFPQFPGLPCKWE